MLNNLNIDYIKQTNEEYSDQFNCKSVMFICEKIDKCNYKFQKILARCLDGKKNGNKLQKMINYVQIRSKQPIRLIKTNLGNNGIRAGNFFEFIYG